VRKEVTAALLLAAQEMQKNGLSIESHVFHKDDLVLLEATNLQTTHPKAKLAPRRYGPFKVLWASPTNCKLELPSQMWIHPVFHNSLLKPYKETTTHGPNFAHPLPEIVGNEEGHYKIERILTSHPTRNRKSTQYLVKWKGYPDSKNSWLPAKELQSTQGLLKQFHNCQVRILTTNQALQAQWKPKEGILLWASPMPPHLKRGSHEKAPSPPDPALRPSYSQIVKMKKPPRDPEKQTRDPRGSSHDPSHDISRDPPVLSRSHDQTCDQTQSCVQTQSPDPPHFGRTTHPLIGTWQTVETKQQSTRSSGIPHSLSQWILELVMPLSV